MTGLQRSLKDLHDIYHKRNEIFQAGTMNIPGIGEVDILNNNIIKPYIDDRLYITVLNANRKKFNKCEIYLFGKGSTLVIRREKSKYSFIRIGQVRNIDIPCPSTKDEYFNLALDYDLDISYEEYLDIIKLFSQINHTVCINVKYENRIDRNS